MNTQEFIFSEFPEIEPSIVEQQDAQEVSYFNNVDLPLYLQSDEEYEDRIIRMLPRNWVISFGVREHLDTLGIAEYVSMTFHRLDKQTIRSIMETSIMASNPETDDEPYSVLSTLYYERIRLIRSIGKAIYENNRNLIPGRIQEILGKVNFDREMYKLTCSDKCIDSIRILSLFCNEPAKKIQHTWLKYRRNKSAQLIQQKVLEWLYRPGGPIMRKAESHFYSLSIASA